MREWLSVTDIGLLVVSVLAVISGLVYAVLWWLSPPWRMQPLLPSANAEKTELRDIKTLSNEQLIMRALSVLVATQTIDIGLAEELESRTDAGKEKK